MEASYDVSNPAYRASLDNFIDDPHVMIEITSICNFACTYCVSSHKTRPKSQMDPGLFSHIARQLTSLTTKPARLHIDGEPTYHPRFVDYVREINSHGLPVSLATNGSLLKKEYADLWMSMVISMSTCPEELTERHGKLSFEKYIANIVNYIANWAETDCAQNITFQIIYYRWTRDAEYAEYNAQKTAFLAEFIGRAGLRDYCTPLNAPDSKAHRLRKKRGQGILSFRKQPISGGGLFPVRGKLVANPGTEVGFCDSPWKRLTIQSDGTVSCCCVDLSGGTAFTDPAEIWRTPLTEIWKRHAGVQALRSGFLAGRVDRDVCKSCLGKGAKTHYVAPLDFPIAATAV